jgi:hypothetical protein
MRALTFSAALSVTETIVVSCFWSISTSRGML